MALLLAGAGVLVATAAAVSLLMALPAAALAEAAGESNAAARARVWLAALVVPTLAGLAAAICALLLHAQGLGATPHLGGLRPHLCLLPLVNAPAGAFALRSFAWLSLLLVAAAPVRMIASAVSGHLLRRMIIDSGAALDLTEADGPTVLTADLRRPISFTAGLLRPVIVVSTALIDRLEPEQVRAIVGHERAHARRRDNLVKLLADGCATLLLLVPTAWYARRRLHKAVEQAADDEAMQAGVAPETLVRALRAIERTANGAPRVPSLAALLIPEPAQPAERRARLEQQAATGRASVSGRAHALVAAAVGIALILVLLLAARQPIEDSLFCAAEQLITAVR